MRKRINALVRDKQIIVHHPFMPGIEIKVLTVGNVTLRLAYLEKFVKFRTSKSLF